jgi:hypothetical protein
VVYGGVPPPIVNGPILLFSVAPVKVASLEILG